MSLVESLQDWKDGVQYYNEGDFQNALKKFMGMADQSAKITFNIGRAYVSMCELQKALQAFELVIKKDGHLAVGHFMLGVVNLMCSKHRDAYQNFNETFRNLRGSKFIDYKQLGMRYKLYKCEVLLNRAVCLSSLGHTDSATEDLLAALECKVEPRHNIIDITLESLQRVETIEFLVMDAIFQPPKSKTANLEKRDYLGKAQVVVDTYEEMHTPLHLKEHEKPSPVLPESKTEETFCVLYEFTAQNAAEVSVKAGEIITVTEKGDDGWFTMITKDGKKTGLVPGSYLEKYDEYEKPKSSEKTLTKRQALLTDLRKKESRQSLRRVPPPLNKPIRLPPGEKPPKLDNSSTDVIKPTNPRPHTIAFGSGNISPSLPSRHSTGFVSPKFPHQHSLGGLVASSSPEGSPPLQKRVPNIPWKSLDDGDYEDIDGPLGMVDPYAINDLISPAIRSSMNGLRGPIKPAPPPKDSKTLKPRVTPPLTPPRPSRSQTVCLQGSAYDQKRSAVFAVPRPSKAPPKLPPTSQNRVRERSVNDKPRSITVDFIVSTTLMVNSTTTAEQLQSSAKGLITGNAFNNLWCEKDGKRIPLNDPKAPSLLDLVKDGELKVWCAP